MFRQGCQLIRMQPTRRRLAALFVLFLDSLTEAASTTSCRLHSKIAFVSGTNRRDSRSFVVEKVIPPIARVAAFANSTSSIIPYSGLGDAIPVLYTNNPNVVYKWLSDHVPTEGCTLGFDVEVSTFLIVERLRVLHLRLRT
jgi:hypothetical protein